MVNAARTAIDATIDRGGVDGDLDSQDVAAPTMITKNATRGW